MMKSGIRIAAITTGPIGKDGRAGKALLVCAVGTKNGVEGILSSKVDVDGTDSTSRIIRMIRGSRFGEQIKLIAFNGIALAGLNVVDAMGLRRWLKTDVIVITRHRPRISLLERSLRSLKKRKGADISERLRLLKGQAKSVQSGGFYVQSYPSGSATMEIANTAVELLRLSHLISRGVSTRESKGRI